MKKMSQPYHLVSLSPWPIMMSFMILNSMIFLVYWFHCNNYMYLFLSMIGINLILFQWWRDVIRESNYQGLHTKKVTLGLKFGMILFIISELMFFFSFFWCYFHMFLSPSIELGSLWPPKGVISFNPYFIPLLNTMILLSSGVTVTISHMFMLKNKLNKCMIFLFFTIILGMIFTYFQYMEYKEAIFSISDSVYGSIFFLGTGFHGFHVLIGTIFLLVTLVRMMNNSFSSNNHLCFEFAAWYWHFVDVVWLFLYLLIYYWSN